MEIRVYGVSLPKIHYAHWLTVERELSDSTVILILSRSVNIECKILFHFEIFIVSYNNDIFPQRPTLTHDTQLFY